MVAEWLLSLTMMMDRVGYALPISVLGLVAAASAFKLLLWSDRSLPRAHRLGRAHFQSRRRFLCTGAASGLGKSLVARLLKDGHLVMACDINDAELTVRCALENVSRSPPMVVEAGWQRLGAVRVAAHHAARRREQGRGTSPQAQRAHDDDVRKDWASAMAEVKAKMGGLDVCLNVAGFLRPAYTQVPLPMLLRQRG